MSTSNGAGSNNANDTSPTVKSVRVKHRTPAEVDAMIKAARQHSRYPARDVAMIGLMYRHGLRVGELCRLRWDQIDLDGAVMRLERLKGGQDNTHPLYGDDMRALRRLPQNGLPWVFVTERGGPMTPAGVRDTLRRLAPLAGLERANPHSFRHGCGSKLVNDNVSLPLIAAYLGHTSTRHTAIYTAVDSRRFRRFKF